MRIRREPVWGDAICELEEDGEDHQLAADEERDAGLQIRIAELVSRLQW